MEKNRDLVVFYDHGKPVCSVHTSIVPPAGAYIDIEGKPYRVTGATFDVYGDHPTGYGILSIRARVHVVKTTSWPQL